MVTYHVNTFRPEVNLSRHSQAFLFLFVLGVWIQCSIGMYAMSNEWFFVVVLVTNDFRPFTPIIAFEADIFLYEKFGMNKWLPYKSSNKICHSTFYFLFLMMVVKTTKCSKHKNNWTQKIYIYSIFVVKSLS